MVSVEEAVRHLLVRGLLWRSRLCGGLLQWLCVGCAVPCCGSCAEAVRCLAVEAVEAVRCLAVEAVEAVRCLAVEAVRRLCGALLWKLCVGCAMPCCGSCAEAVRCLAVEAVQRLCGVELYVGLSR
jgi:hypothetical protein